MSRSSTHLEPLLGLDDVLFVLLQRLLAQRKRVPGLLSELGQCGLRCLQTASPGTVQSSDEDASSTPKTEHPEGNNKVRVYPLTVPSNIIV